LLDLVKRPPQSAREMFDRPGVSYRVARKFASQILRALEESRQFDPSVLETPPRNNWKPPSRLARLRIESLKNWRQAKAKELNLHVGVVFPANLLENLAVIPPADMQGLSEMPGMRRWRVREFGEEVLHLINNHNSQTIEPSGN
jgi:superfamily II DNA helicase RecQ